MIGSARRCDVVLAGASVSPVHAELAIDDSGVWLCAHSPVTIDGQAIVGWSQLSVVDPVPVRLGGREIVVGLVSGRRGEVAALPPPASPPPPAKTEPVAPRPLPPPVAALRPAALPVPSGPAAGGSSSAAGEIVEGDAIAAAAAARLAELFAMPATTREAGRQTRPSGILKRRFLRLTINSWLVIMVSGAISAFVFVTREVPLATAGHSLRADFIPPPPSAHRPAPAKRSAPLPPGTTALAATALITGDFPKALSLYRRLGDEDSKFQPFVRGLEQRLKGQCGGDAAGRGGSCP